MVIGSSLPKRFMATSNSVPFLNETVDRMLEILSMTSTIASTMLYNAVFLKRRPDAEMVENRLTV